MSEQPIGSIRYDFNAVESTQEIARQLAQSGAVHGTVVTASHQTKGRGRRGATWQDQPGASALLTVLVRPSMPLSDVWRIGFIASLAAAVALRDFGVVAQVQWPNDLMIAECKVGGVLVEAAGQGAWALGIGVNAGQAEFGDVAGFAKPPTSVRITAVAAGGDSWPNAAQIIDKIIEHLNVTWTRFGCAEDGLVEAWREIQRVDYSQAGIDLATGDVVSGILRDVRPDDGAGLIDVATPGGVTRIAALPTTGPA
jgi:biotin-[acetyl-CoA-carboxylase] ligase BirA-like protein